MLPLIADQGIGFMEAAGHSKRMVTGAGWWRWTFGMIGILLGIASIAAVAVIEIVARVFYQTNEWVGLVIGILLFLLSRFFPAVLDLLHQRAVHRLRRRRRGAREEWRAAGHPAGSSGPPAYGAPVSPIVAGRRPEATAAPPCRGPAATTPGRPRRTRSRRRRLRPPLAAPASQAASGRPAGGAGPEQTAVTDPGAPARAGAPGATGAAGTDELSRTCPGASAACRQSWRKKPLMG